MKSFDGLPRYRSARSDGSRNERFGMASNFKEAMEVGCTMDHLCISYLWRDEGHLSVIFYMLRRKLADWTCMSILMKVDYQLGLRNRVSLIKPQRLLGG